MLIKDSFHQLMQMICCQVCSQFSPFNAFELTLTSLLFEATQLLKTKHRGKDKAQANKNNKQTEEKEKETYQ